MRKQKFYSALELTVLEAQVIANTLTIEFKIPRVPITYVSYLLDDANAMYNTGRKDISIRKDRPKLSTLLHEIGHHLQFTGYDHPWGLRGNAHNEVYQKAIRRVVNRFRKVFDAPDFVYISINQILEPKRK